MALGCLVGASVLLSAGYSHSLRTERNGLYHGRDTIPHWAYFDLDENEYFKAAGNCDGCHGYDETGFASVDEDGNDISPITTWRASMMANSGRDPFFRAKMSHESSINPQHQVALEDKCTTCHSPLGHFSAHYEGQTYSLTDLESDPMGQDGVSCMGCHKQTDENLGANHSGELHYADSMIEYGPFDKPFQAPMQDFLQLTPDFGAHVTDAGFCAGCHTLLTNSVDLQGNFTGTTFVEQATYHEWLNSVYADANGATCQSCHMPRVTEGVVIAANYLILTPRTPYGKHDLAGANSFMLKLMKEHRDQLDIRAGDVHFDAAIANTLTNLQQNSLTATLQFEGLVEDSAVFSLRLRNLVGHKFPSGYPTRRAFVEFVVTNQLGDTVFSSGIMDANYELPTENSTYEPHYDLITNPDQVQIYEMVMGNVNGQVTNVLERAYQPLKDNRLVPIGFTTSHAVYDTTAIVGNASSDPDFNFDGFEGSGTDDVHFHVKLSENEDSLNAFATVYYQSIPRKTVADMFDISTPQIDTFEVMYNSADHTPVLVASDSLTAIPVLMSLEDVELSRMEIRPNPSDGWIWFNNLPKQKSVAVSIYSTQGQLLRSTDPHNGKGVQLPQASGIYLVAVRLGSAERVFKVIRK